MSAALALTCFWVAPKRCWNCADQHFLPGSFCAVHSTAAPAPLNKVSQATRRAREKIRAEKARNQLASPHAAQDAAPAACRACSSLANSAVPASAGAATFLRGR